MAQEIQNLIHQFNQQVETAIQNAWGAETDKGHLQALSTEIVTLVDHFHQIGDASFEQLNNGEASFLEWVVCYDWTYVTKDFFVLWRDILFELKKAWIKLSVREISHFDYLNLKAKARTVLENAAQDVSHFISAETLAQRNQNVAISNWKFEDNPWSIYKEQFNLIPEQCKNLYQQADDLWNATGTYVVIHSQVSDDFKDYLGTIYDTELEIKEILSQLGDDQPIKGTEIIHTIEKLQKTLYATNNIDAFTNEMDEHIAKLAKEQKFSIGTSGGMLTYNQVNLQQDTRKWLETEIVPGISELFTIKESISNKINLNLVNTKNLLAADRQEGQQVDRKDLEQVLGNFLKGLEKSKKRIQELRTFSDEKLNAQFNIAQIYEGNFLLQTMEQTLNQYRKSQQQTWYSFKQWIQERFAFLQKIQRNIQDEEVLSPAEKIVRMVRYRTPEAENDYYNNMFLTHSWIGDFFNVGRETELAHITSIIDNWILGYRGAVILTGTRLCGKTLFGEIVAKKYFNHKTIRLNPESRIEVEGRNYETTFNLKDALIFIKKYGRLSNLLVWIDDIEMWHNDKIALAENVQSLTQFIDQGPGQLFIMVSMSNWMKAHLDQCLEVDRSFQGEVNLDKMSLREVTEIILTRHSATHMELIDEEREEVPLPKIRKMIDRIYRISNGNVGASLQRWAYIVQKYDEESVIAKPIFDYQLPEFVSTDSALLLRAIMMERRTNEYQLRKLFGPAFKDVYKVILLRLLNLGLVRRDNLWLEINPFLLNDVGELLVEKLGFNLNNKKMYEREIKL